MPVLVSIGYSSCHWCHVMARESFADPAIGALVNEHFVAIKVDREEHPDVDQVFMRATQALTGQGGWPMTIFCTPTGEPFFAGTYFPPQPRGGLPSFRQLVEAMAQVWAERRQEAVDTAATIVQQIAELDRPPAAVGEGSLVPHRLLTAVHSQFDPEHGGWGGAPKFPQAPLLDALLVRTDPLGNGRALYTLESMARGGIHDQLGGGFHRYSVDAGWEVPHFEKMLYDNALLLGTYTRGWLRATPDDGTEQRELFERVVRGIVGWLAEEMLLPGGGFAASLDADSLDDSGEHAEGLSTCGARSSSTSTWARTPNSLRGLPRHPRREPADGCPCPHRWQRTVHAATARQSAPRPIGQRHRGAEGEPRPPAAA